MTSKFRSSANITRAECARMLGISSRDITFLMGCGLPFIKHGREGVRFNVGRVNDAVTSPALVQLLTMLKGMHEAAHAQELAAARASDKAKRAARKAAR